MDMKGNNMRGKQRGMTLVGFLRGDTDLGNELVGTPRPARRPSK